MRDFFYYRCQECKDTGKVGSLWWRHICPKCGGNPGSYPIQHPECSELNTVVPEITPLPTSSATDVHDMNVEHRLWDSFWDFFRC